jgi:hypothetical protein
MVLQKWRTMGLMKAAIGKPQTRGESCQTPPWRLCLTQLDHLGSACPTWTWQ